MAVETHRVPIQVTKYQVVTGFILSQFTEVVQEQLSLGWKPCGGVSVCINESGNLIFSQALTKAEWECMRFDIDSALFLKSADQPPVSENKD